MRLLSAVVGPFFVLASLALCQPTPAPPASSTLPALEAVDVHVSAPGVSPSGRFSLPGGRFEFYATTIQMFVRIAWNVPEDRISGGPSWIDTDRFDVIAKTAKTVPMETQRRLLQAILAERFGLAVHTDEKPIAVFLLTAGKRVQLKESSGSDEEPAGCKPNQAGEAQRSIACRNTTMASLAELLSNAANPDITHPVVDKTGLTRAYDFTLTWTPRALFGANGGTSIFDAVDKQLGLKIDEGKAPMPVLMVDHVNRTPTENLPNVVTMLSAAPKEFEVSTVRPSKPGTLGQRLMIQPGGRLDATNFPLRQLIAFAWNVEPEMVVNGEKWLESDRYDVVGTGANTGSIDVIRQMLQAVLLDRFKLAVHREDRPMPVFGIEQSKRGAKLKESDGGSVSSCKVADAEARRFFTCTNTTMAQFAERLHPQTPNSLPHPIIDLTELKGAYDFVLSWTRPIGPGQLLPAPTATPAAQSGQSALTAETPASTITLAEAFESELGLKISEQKHPMPVVVIDRISRSPTDN